MKKISLFFLSLFTLLLTSCNLGGTPSDKTDAESDELTDTKEVETVLVEGYELEMTCGSDFDENQITVKVTFTDETTAVYTKEALAFDYTNYDNSKAGKSIIKVTVIELNVSQNIEIEFVEEVKVKSIEIMDYQETIYLNEDYVESSVVIKVTFTDDSNKMYSDQDLTFDYSDFDNETLGKTEIGVRINELNITTKINIEVIINPNHEEPIAFKLLMIGNSFSDDTVQWVHEICDDLNIDFTIANLYIGGCTLATHLRNLNNNLSAYEYVSYDKNSKTWSRQANTSIAAALAKENWNYVSLQQGSSESGLANSYDDIEAIMDKVLALKGDVKFIWNMTWAYQQNSNHSNFGTYSHDQMTMYNAIINAVKTKVVPNERFVGIVPNGTAVQNARTSFIGDNLCRDIYCHLSLDFGRYIVGLTLVSMLTGADISKINYSPNLSKVYRDVAIESAINAINNPFEVTLSKYTEEEAYDLTNYIAIDYEPVGCAYWFSQDVNNYNKLITNASNSMNFVASKRFTKTELPVGSLIVCQNGYQYRTEAWVDDTLQATRPDNVSVKYVEVTEAWWGNYQYRAFNISATNGASLEFQLKEAINAFAIYVPKDLYSGNQKNPYAANDVTLFANKGLDINNYEAYDYIYSNGFYNSYNDSIILNINFFDETGTFCHQYLCTEGFNRNKLPVGSVIIVDSGYQYRPDGWITSAVNKNRPGNVSTNVVVVDEAWWGDYTVRGFNISSQPLSSINQIHYDVTQHFRIYIPKK